MTDTLARFEIIDAPDMNLTGSVDVIFPLGAPTGQGHLKQLEQRLVVVQADLVGAVRPLLAGGLLLGELLEGVSDDIGEAANEDLDA